MIAKGITEQQLMMAASDVGVSIVVTPLNLKGTRHRVKVNLSGKKDEDGNYRWQRVSASQFANERRVHAVCWHGFRDYFRACFDRAPDAEFRTALDYWNGSDDFEERYRASGHQNVGSQFAPTYAAECCRCPERGLAV